MLGGLILFIIFSEVNSQICKKEGKLPDSHPRYYISCQMVEGELKELREQCPGQMVFSQSDGQCVESNADNKNHVHCFAPGIKCIGCTSMVNCTETTENNTKKFDNRDLAPCDSGELCTDGIGCVRNPSALCKFGPFICTDSGIFPDPYDCSSYHKCTLEPGKLEKYKDNTTYCGGGEAFNVATSKCELISQSAPCHDRPVTKCSQEFEIGPLPDNPRIYFVCVKRGNTLTPNLFNCPPDHKFNVLNITCIPT